ncbi:MAG: tRNA pseudouridine(38-40) synthase TruA [Acidobacteria bacterium]|nr:tRNA pseudouridine(38-40) synthase TruA [Acidobacteriota bacterium]MBI3279013.1 tRNA pseudouridine(38-40) synthase TruA [Acidobacteriota bacterium]
MRRIKLTIAYDGTELFGWQVQPNLPTIQAALESAFELIEKKHVHVAGSGRTDAGVHALAQAAAVTIENRIPLDNLRRALNRQLAPSIRVTAVEEVPPGFHPRYDALSKTYEYRIFTGEICSPFERRYVHHHPYPLDVPRMVELAPFWEGEHDFSAFAAADEADALGRSRVRRIFRSRLEAAPPRLVYRVTGSGFLKHMVRNMAGTLLQAGQGNLDAAGFRGLLGAPAGVKAGPTAPARGLFLVEVTY